MSYHLDLFSPETYVAFIRSDQTISGFRFRQRNLAKRVSPGDKFVCYMTKLSRWFGILEVQSNPFQDTTPIFYPENDPFVIRFRVKPIALLAVDKAIPIYEDEVWDRLSFTRGQVKGSSTWTGKIRASLVQLDESDGAFLEGLIRRQIDEDRIYPVDSVEFTRLATHKKVRRVDKDVSVTVPEDIPSAEEVEAPRVGDVRESIRIQALLCDIGARMGMQIWVPRSDRTAVNTEWGGEHPPILDRLPLNYDDITLRTIEQIDILWLRGRAIVRAFEVEHTTSIYSGILRMADLLALQPNMEIQLHLVAPMARREKVFQELRRPVFSLLDRGPLAEICTYLSYDSVRELAEQPLLSHLSDSVLEEYEEEASD